MHNSESDISTNLHSPVMNWEQTLTEVNVSLVVSANATRGNVDVQVTANSLKVLLSGQTIFQGILFGRVKTSDSTWFMASNTVHIVLEKAVKGEVWAGVLKDEFLDDLKVRAIKQKLLLERFGEENPGFDFSDAQFSGDTVPEPRTFMNRLDCMYR